MNYDVGFHSTATLTNTCEFIVGYGARGLPTSFKTELCSTQQCFMPILFFFVCPLDFCCWIAGCGFRLRLYPHRLPSTNTYYWKLMIIFVVLCWLLFVARSRILLRAYGMSIASLYQFSVQPQNHDRKKKNKKTLSIPHFFASACLVNIKLCTTQCNATHSIAIHLY